MDLSILKKLAVTSGPFQVATSSSPIEMQGDYRLNASGGLACGLFCCLLFLCNRLFGLSRFFRICIG
jgi:hypothetical protein